MNVKICFLLRLGSDLLIWLKPLIALKIGILSATMSMLNRLSSEAEVRDDWMYVVKDKI